jgi:hypothetical protein
MNDNNGVDIDGPPPIIMPCQFAGPSETPSAMEVMGVYDERGVWWIMYRIETTHGSFVYFATPETARVVEQETGHARAAQLTTPFVPPNQAG